MNNAPFESTYNEYERKFAFLGTGKYLWDNNFERAKLWGKQHCDDSFYVVEFEFVITEDDNLEFLDLVGSMQDIHHFKQLYQRVVREKKLLIHNKPTMGKIIEILKEMEKDSPGIFPFKAIRAIDYYYSTTKNVQNESLPYRTDKPQHFFHLNPVFVICVIGNSNPICKNPRIIFRS